MDRRVDGWCIVLYGDCMVLYNKRKPGGFGFARPGGARAQARPLPPRFKSRLFYIYGAT